MTNNKKKFDLIELKSTKKIIRKNQNQDQPYESMLPIIMTKNSANEEGNQSRISINFVKRGKKQNKATNSEIVK